MKQQDLERLSELLQQMIDELKEVKRHFVELFERCEQDQQND